SVPHLAFAICRYSAGRKGAGAKCGVVRSWRLLARRRRNRADAYRSRPPVDPPAPSLQNSGRGRGGGGVMELVLSIGIGVLIGSGVWLLLRPRTYQVIIGLSLISYGVNLFIFSMGRLRVNAPPVQAPG